jgi:hypothetical protein
MMKTLTHYVQDMHKTREGGEMKVGPRNLGNTNDSGFPFGSFSPDIKLKKPGICQQ